MKIKGPRLTTMWVFTTAKTYPIPYAWRLTALKNLIIPFTIVELLTIVVAWLNSMRYAYSTKRYHVASESRVSETLFIVSNIVILALFVLLPSCEILLEF